MATFFYTNGLSVCLKWFPMTAYQQFKVMLLGNALAYPYLPKKQHVYVDEGGPYDPSQCELTATGYARGHGNAGRQWATISLNANLSTNKVEVWMNTLTWPDLEEGKTIVGACLIFESGVPGDDDTDNLLIAYIDFPDQVTSGNDVILSLPGEGTPGVLQVSA